MRERLEQFCFAESLGLVIWVVIVPLLGLNQTSLLVGPNHWVIQVLHLVVGLGAIALAETLARRIKGRLPRNGEIQGTTLARETRS